MKKEYRQAFSEVDTIINMMPLELVNKIPRRFIEMVREEKDISYTPIIKEPLEEEKLMNETIIILGLIYRDFLVSKEKRKELQLSDAEELRQVEEEIREKYNPDNLFKKSPNTQHIEEDKKKEELTSLVVQEEKWYQKIWNVIKNIFHIEKKKI